MANRRLYGNHYRYERDMVDLHFKISIGASGAPTISRAQGLASIVNNSAGNYTLTLTDSFNSLLSIEVQQLMATGALDAPICQIISEDVASAKTIVMQFYAIDNTTATNPDNGAVLYIRLACRNAST